MKKIEQIKFNDKIAIILSVILAVVVFLLIYGPYSLDVTNDSWILLQYDGTDMMQHYAGWAQYRISDWTYPLGYANMLAYGDGTYITYTDSIPYVAIFFKLFRDILPVRFQYFGWFILLCFVLQGVGACLLIKRKFPSYVKVLVGEVFFLTAPIFLERNFKHTALSAQWLILFAIYYYLEYRKKDKDTKLPWQMILLTTLTVGIHPYFLPIVMIFVLLIAIEAIIKKYSVVKILGYAVLTVVFPYVAGVVIGAIGTDVKNTRAGYGSFGMNLNALFNPNSASGFVWSHVLPQREQAYSTYEGFNYIGLGMLILMVSCFILCLVKMIQNTEYMHVILKAVKRNIPLIGCMAFMTLFAMTNNITWDGQSVFFVPLSTELVEMASIFRSSGRMFWPVYYLIMLVLIYCLLSISAKKIAVAVLSILLFVQIYDMRDMFAIRYEGLKELSGRQTILDDENLIEVSDKEMLIIIGTENFELERVLAVWAAEHGMGVGYSVANTGEYKNAEMYTKYFEEAMWEGIMRDDIVYVTLDTDVIQLWRERLVDDVYNEYQRGFYYFVYKD